jgi:hypothetical protein
MYKTTIAERSTVRAWRDRNYRPLTYRPCLCCSKIIHARNDICEDCWKQTKGLSHEEFLELLRQRQRESIPVPQAQAQP